MAVIGTANTAFYVGMSLSFVIIAVVVFLVARILMFASRIAEQANVAADALTAVHANTNALSGVATVNARALAILNGARSLREELDR